MTPPRPSRFLIAAVICLITCAVTAGIAFALHLPHAAPICRTLQMAGDTAGVTENAAEITLGDVIFTDDFENGVPESWTFAAGDEWILDNGGFGDMSDSVGPEGHGNWAKAGKSSWRDYRFSAQIIEERDGAGAVLLAVRFQDPRNYYALRWTAGRPDRLELVRTVDGNSYVLAASEGHDELTEMGFTLAVAVSGDLLIGYLEDRPILQAYAGDCTNGPIAIGQMRRKVLVDNVQVTRIVSEGPASAFMRHLDFQYGLKPKYFLRDTGPMSVPFVLTNNADKALQQMHIELALHEYYDPHARRSAPDGTRPLFEPTTADIETLAPGDRTTIDFTLDTRLLKAGRYIFKGQVSVPGRDLVRDEIFHFGIARNWNPDRFNYFAWGLPGDEETIIDYVEHGHTMGIGGGRAQPIDWEHDGKPIPRQDRPSRYGPAKRSPFHTYDLCLKHGMISGTNLQSTHGQFPDYVYGRDAGGDSTPLPLPYHPEFHDFSVNFAKTHAQQYGEYPGYRLMNINTETEHHNHPDYSELGIQKAKEEFGGPPPEQAIKMYPQPHTEIEGMDGGDGIISDDNQMLKFYRWFWLKGEGFNELAIDMAGAVRQTDSDITVFHDPAARQPYFRDRHDGIHCWDWTYTVPNALTVPYKTEVLLAMDDGVYDKVCNYVQVLWKAGIVSPEKECPSASIIRLGLLLNMTRDVFAVGHWNTEWMRNVENRDRWEGVKELANRLWKPLGPVITRLQTPRRNVAFFVSHTNALFGAAPTAARKFHAYAAWHEAFMRAGLPVDIVFEQDVIDGELSDYDALFIPFGDITSESAYEQIEQFAEDGGRVVADHNLGYDVPGVQTLTATLDHMIYPEWAWRRIKNDDGVSAELRTKVMMDVVAEISEVFAPELSGEPISNTVWLIVNERQFEGVRYIFAINDKREPGDQVGQYEAMFERGVPLYNGQIRLPDSGNVAAAYDLVAHRRVAVERTGEGLQWSRHYEPAFGRVFACLPQPIDSLELTVPDDPVLRGENFHLQARVLDGAGNPVRGAIPLEVAIEDGHGARSEYSDFYAAAGGVWEMTGHIAINDARGPWKVTVTDLASGRDVSKYFRVGEHPSI